MSKFKIAVIAIFSIAIVIGLILFATAKSSNSIGSANLVVWGTVEYQAFNAAYKSSSIANNKSVKVTYVKKDPADFDQNFVEALADGSGPDIVILREDEVYKNRNKLFTIPYKNYPVRNFKDTFIEEGEMFLTSDGIISLPFMVDPLVMYWNRNTFSNNVIAQPPRYWDEIYTMIDKITKKDNNANILEATVALGEWRNVVNAKEILSMMLLQNGTPITSRQNNSVVSVLNSSFGQAVPPSQSAVNLYTQFSNPTAPTYTWNRSLPNSLNMFLAGNLAIYFGFASEVYSIQQKNSNLNFDVTYVPQIRNTTKKTVFGHMYSLSIVKQSQQIVAAYSLIAALTEPASIKAAEAITGLPPVRRDLLADRPTDAANRVVFYDSALISHAWIDPDPVSSSNTFRDMIESITSGKSRTAESINRADGELSDQLK